MFSTIISGLALVCRTRIIQNKRANPFSNVCGNQIW